MARNEIFDQLNVIFREVFDDDTIILNETTNANDIEDWDSFEQINLVVAIEKQFSIEFDMNEVSTMKNVGDMVNVIITKVNE